MRSGLYRASLRRGSLVKLTKMEGEHGRPIKPIIYVFRNILEPEIRGFSVGIENSGMTRQVDLRRIYASPSPSPPPNVHRFRCVTIKAVGGSRDQINDVINSIKYHRGRQQCGRIPRGIGSEASVFSPSPRSALISSFSFIVFSPSTSLSLSLFAGLLPLSFSHPSSYDLFLFPADG